MKQNRGIALLIITLAGMASLMGLPSGRAYSATPTPIASPTPIVLQTIAPTETEIYLYLRNTPTLIPFGSPVPGLNLDVDNGQAADQAINIYRYFNHDHVFDYLGVVALAIIAIIYVVRIINRSSRIR